MEKLTLGNFTGTVFFVDIKNFLQISEVLTPRQLRKFVLKAIHPLSKCIKKHGGYICQIQGDAILSVFGLNERKKDHAKSAVECALEIQELLNKLNPIIIADMSVPLGVNIGICSGAMYSGNIKVADHKEFTVLGKTVNLAARYQKLNKHYGTNILIDETVFAYIKKSIVVRKLDRVEIKGCNEPVELFEVLFFKKDKNKTNDRKRIYYERGFINYLRDEWDKAIQYFQKVSIDNEYGKMLKKCRGINIFLNLPGNNESNKK